MKPGSSAAHVAQDWCSAIRLEAAPSLRRVRLPLITLPATEKRRSTGADVAGKARYALMYYKGHMRNANSTGK